MFVIKYYACLGRKVPDTESTHVTFSLKLWDKSVALNQESICKNVKYTVVSPTVMFNCLKDKFRCSVGNLVNNAMIYCQNDYNNILYLSFKQETK